jgi:membrane associated rhomboid family serine protease
MLLRTVSDFRRAMDLSLVLDEEGIAHELRSGPGEIWGIVVGDGDAERADQALRAFEAENKPALPQPAEPEKGSAAVLSGMVFALIVFGFPLVQTPLWHERGAADAAAILRGEWWRCVTALTLHADEGHAAGNAALGGILLAFLSRRLGSGIAALLLVASGALGTLCAAELLRRNFVSIGASTAVFGALGALAMLEALDPSSRRRAFVPVAAGLALLGFLGTGPHADLAGHLFGFASGALLGAVCSRLKTLSVAAQTFCAVASLAAPALAWWLAFKTP